MTTTSIIWSASGEILAIRPLYSEFWKHEGPIEVGQYFSEHDSFLSDQITAGEIVYHYTNLEALRGIVSEGGIWASDVRLMNDRAELTYALRQMRSSIDSKNKGEVSDQALDSVFDPGRIWQFVACFSKARDQLSQWRAYGTKVGVSIGFSRAHLARASKIQAAQLVDCQYFRPSHFSTIESDLATIISALRAPGAINAQGALIDVDLQIALTRKVVSIAAAIKHHSFVEEREVRLISPVDRVDDKIHFRSSLSSLIPFKKISIDRRQAAFEDRVPYTNELGMLEVLVWPSGVDNQILDAIDMLLSKVGPVLVRRSNSPYRT